MGFQSQEGIDEMKKNWEDKPFDDGLLYVVDGELLNHMIKIMKVFKMSPEIATILPEYRQVLNYMIKSIIQCSNYPTGEPAFDVDLDGSIGAGTAADDGHSQAAAEVQPKVVAAREPKLRTLHWMFLPLHGGSTAWCIALTRALATAVLCSHASSALD